MDRVIIMVMGVSGCGKSTLGVGISELIEDSLFLEGDDFHPTENIEKMSQGQALTDQDRQPWFEKLVEACQAGLTNGKSVIFSCSALKKKYRDFLRAELPDLQIVHPLGSFALISERMNTRDHFMPVDLLKSQFDTLEDPSAEPDVITVKIEHSPEQQIQQVFRHLSE